MTARLLEPRRVPETCGPDAVGVHARRGWHGSAGLSGQVAAGKFIAVVTKPGLTLPHLAVVAGLAVAWYAIAIPRRTS